MSLSSNLGIGRLGPNRELKKAVEAFWKGKIKEDELKQVAKQIRKNNWQMQKDAGINLIPSNDFSFYDQVLDMTATVGAIPERYKFSGDNIDIDTYFAMARGKQEVPAMEMTKWFDTNYHYTVPEFKRDQNFKISSQKMFEEFEEAKQAGFDTKPVIIGPISYLLLGKEKDGGDQLDLLPKLLPVYEEIISRLSNAGARWIQIDEPFLSMDLTEEQRSKYYDTYQKLSSVSGDSKLLIATYFEGLNDNMEAAIKLPISALHIDLVRASDQLEKIIELAPQNLTLSLGVIDGRNIWKANLNSILEQIEKATAKLGKDRVIVAPSCSLLHSPIDLDMETEMDVEIKNWLAFAKQKLEEVAVLTKAVNEGADSVKEILEENAAAVKSRQTSAKIHNEQIKSRVGSIDDNMVRRNSPYLERKKLQDGALNLPLLPTTTIGSFPQTKEVRVKRAEHKKGVIDDAIYNEFLKLETQKCIRFQEHVGLDMLVHGEFERNDMVEYFGEQLEGFVFTKNGWVQSYGSRGVKPPIIFGDISRKSAMTVEWSKYAQSLTEKQMKGMLTGPVTILQWSFVRNDQPREITCKQIALAIRDEAVDLESAGIQAIQIDEPALREGLPLRRSDWDDYLKWAVDSFKISACGVKDATQIHTHMCYSEFNDIIKSIADMDADVISVEASRSDMELLEAFIEFKYPNEIGPGVYDIHTPRLPDKEEMAELLRKALKVLSPAQLWVNPDCGLKTRSWEQVEPALKSMVEAAKIVRDELDEDEKISNSA